MSTITEVQPMDTVHMRLPVQQTPGSATAPSRRARIKLDPIRALEPARKKLSTIEAQRVMAVADDTKRKCEIISVLPSVLNNLDKYSGLIGADILAQLSDHKTVYDKFVSLELRHTDITLQISQSESAPQDDIPEEMEATSKQLPTPPASRPTSRDLSSRGSIRYRHSSAIGLTGNDLESQLDEATTQMKSTEIQLQISMRNLMRVFSLNPGVVNLLIVEVGNSKSKEGTYMVSQLNELKDILMEKLLMSPLEENEKMRYLSQVCSPSLLCTAYVVALVNNTEHLLDCRIFLTKLIFLPLTKFRFLRKKEVML